MTNKVRRVRGVPPDYDLYRGGLTYAFKDTPANYHMAKQRIVRVNDSQNGIDWAGGDLSAGDQKIVSLKDGVDPGDAVNKAQLDAVAQPPGTMEVAQGFGEAFMRTGPVPIGTINANQWVDLSQMDQTMGTPKGIHFVLPDGRFSFSLAGYWKITTQIVGDGGWLNTVRNLGIRWVNITDGDVVVDETRWIVMTPAVNINVVVTYVIPDDALGKEYRLQWGDPREQHGATATLSDMKINIESVIADWQGEA